MYTVHVCEGWQGVGPWEEEQSVLEAVQRCSKMVASAAGSQCSPHTGQVSADGYKEAAEGA